MRRILGPALVILVAGCAKKVQAPTVQTALVTRRDIIVDAQANGVTLHAGLPELAQGQYGVVLANNLATPLKVRLPKSQ